jgi:hypothetical protein
MMRCKGKEMAEEGDSFAKVIRKWTLVEGKEIQNMLQWIWMDPKSNNGQNELIWVVG